MLTTPELPFLVDLNFDQHATTIPAHTPGMQVVDRPHLSYVDCGLSCDTFNVFHIRNGAALLPEEFDRAILNYNRRNWAFTVWVEASQRTERVMAMLKANGLKEVNREPGMVLALDDYEFANQNAALARAVTTTTDLIEFGQVLSQGWTPPDENVVCYYETVAPVVLATGSPARFFLLDYQGMPVSTAELFDSGNGTAGIYNVSTLEAYRGRGLGTVLMRQVLDEAKRAGFRYAVLQASDFGVRIYQRLGFQVVTQFYEYQRG